MKRKEIDLVDGLLNKSELAQVRLSVVAQRLGTPLGVGLIKALEKAGYQVYTQGNATYVSPPIL
ncbi:MAG: hypothetical protein GF334_10335 [Candidatus Altiarchaeales archaeon]|nr:hypothetical protein [Candidatus Altiarchaeales archaeon]